MKSADSTKRSFFFVINIKWLLKRQYTKSQLSQKHYWEYFVITDRKCQFWILKIAFLADKGYLGKPLLSNHWVILSSGNVENIRNFQGWGLTRLAYEKISVYQGTLKICFSSSGFVYETFFADFFTIQPACHVLPGRPVIFTSCHLEHQLEYLLFGNKKYWHFSVSLLSRFIVFPNHSDTDRIVCILVTNSQSYFNIFFPLWVFLNS